MDNSLFSKLQHLINIKTSEKKELITYIQTETNFLLNDDQIEIKDKKITLYLNSNQKLIFIKNKVKEALIKKGYNL